MNRRELFQQLAGVAAVNGLVSEISVVSAESRPALVVFEAPSGISDDTATRLKKYYEDSMKETAFADVKIIVLGDGMRATFFDRDGNACNQRILDYLDALDTMKTREDAASLLEIKDSMRRR